MPDLQMKTFTKEAFLFKKLKQLQPEKIDSILLGNTAGLIVKQYFSNTICKHITDNFWHHPDNRSARDFPASIVGTSHYQQSLPDYFSAVKNYRPNMDLLFNDTEHVFKHVIDVMQAYFRHKNITLRAAQHHNQMASPFMMQAWSGQEDYALSPHEDRSYCSSPQQAGFEIQQAAKNGVMAMNICVQNTPASGQLCYWNTLVDDQIRCDLELSYSGSDYPAEQLATTDQQIIEIETGDVYCFNAAAVHAVKTLNSDTTRVTLAFLMAYLDQDTVLYWI